jgi:cyanophycin synthetase
MRVLERSVYRGPHLYSGTPMVRVLLDLGEFEELPTDRLPGFTDALLEALPGLRRHGCSLHRPGGLVERMREGTWLGHVVEHVALELQTAAGSPVSRGKTRSAAGRPGVYHVLFAYREERVGLAAGRLALETVAGMLPDRPGVEGLRILGPGVADADQLRSLVERSQLGPTTRSIADAARRRRIPVERLDDRSLIRLGTGERQVQLRASVTGRTSHLGVLTAGDKERTKVVLAGGSVPVPRGTVVETAEAAVAEAARLGGPVVTKPLNGNHGRGVSLGLVGDDAVRTGFAAAVRHGPRVVVEEQLTGRDYRLLVVGGRLVAAAERVPARVIGDGEASVRALINRLNADPRRGTGHEKPLTAVRIDRELQRALAAQSLALDDIPAAGHVVRLRETANLSTGGEAVDRTDEVHPENRALAERAARLVGLDVAGLDVLALDIAQPIARGGGVIEVNAAPGFRMHLEPSSGLPRDAGGAVVDMLYPRASAARVPIVSVTGTNGKSTTVRMIDHILRATGVCTGATTTTGVFVGGHLVRSGDSSGPKSARTVLADPAVQAAVLETARGGILREGLAYDRADVGIVLNVSADHLGLKGIDTLQQLAAVKSVVARQVHRRGTSVLNADDRRVLRMSRIAGGRVAYLTLRGDDLSPTLREHVDGGGVLAARMPDGALVLHARGERHEVLHEAEVPATLGGAAAFNVQNALAAIIATHALGVERGAIAAALRTFTSSFEQNPGRLNVTTAPGFTTILDYAHNAAALEALGEAIRALRPRHDRVIGVISTPGDRRDEDMLEIGRISAALFDDVIFRERPDGRGRAEGDVVALLSMGAEGAGMSPEHVHRVIDERAAMATALGMAGPRDLVALTVTDVDAVWRQIHSWPAPAASADREVPA